MATGTELPTSPGFAARTWRFLLAGRPVLALAVVWLITAGHTMNFREMGVSQGWVAADVYALHSIYLLAIPLLLLACPWLGQRLSCAVLTEVGLALVVVGSFVNGILIHAPLVFFLAGRIAAGAGAGLVMYFAPRLLDIHSENLMTWAAILVPVAGPAAVAGASMIYGWSAWEWGFLVEGTAALMSLVLLSVAKLPDPPPVALRGSLTFLPWLTLGSAALLACLHWGQLQGWLESFHILVVVAVGLFALSMTFFLVWPQVDRLAVREGWVRLALFFFGGVVQFFHGTTMTIYSGLFVNFSPWQRSWLVWSMPVGVATSLLTARLVMQKWRISLGLPWAIVGLLVLAAGMFSLNEATLEWPFWQTLNVVDLNWFAAPQHWELATGRFLVGVGIGLFMIAADGMVSPDPEREEKVRPFFLVFQFLGGSIGMGLLVSFLLIGRPIQYSYVADRDYIQAEQLAEHRTALRDALIQAGERAPDRQAEVLLYRAANYESDNLVYAQIYATFMVAALSLAAVCSGLLALSWLQPPATGRPQDRV